VKRVAILLVSVVVIGLTVWVCFFPPPKLSNHVIGDEKCDICGEPAVYTLKMEGRYLVGDYCRIHRWYGMVHGSPWNTLTKVVLGAAVFGVIYAVTSLLGRKERVPTDDDQTNGDQIDDRAFMREAKP
jgi:hypothetical protein